MISSMIVPVYMSPHSCPTLFSPGQHREIGRFLFHPFRRDDAVPETLPRHAFPDACRASFTRTSFPQRKKRSHWGPPTGSSEEKSSILAGETPALQPFRCPQLRAARSRIAIDLFFARRHRLLSQQPVDTL